MIQHIAGLTTHVRWRPAICAGLACFAASLTVAALLSARIGLGMGDVPVIAFWSGPLAFAVATLQMAAGSRVGERARSVIWLTLIGGGSLVAFVWTLAVSSILGPWFQASSIPVLFCWVAGVLIGLTAGLVAGNHVTVHEGILAGSLLMLVSLGLAIRSEDLVAFISGDQMLEVVIVKATDRNQPFQVDGSVQTALGEEGVAQLRAAGITGRLILASVGSHGMGSRRSRAVIVLGEAIEHASYGSPIDAPSSTSCRAESGELIRRRLPP